MAKIILPSINDFHWKREGEQTPIGLSISQGYTGLYVAFRDLEGNVTRVRIPKKYSFLIVESDTEIEKENVNND